MKPYNIAMPHTDPDHVIQSSIAIASLTDPVTFYRMDHPSKPIEVTIVFVLAVKESQQQVKVIETLMNILRDQQFKIGRASCRERVKRAVVAGPLKKQE